MARLAAAPGVEEAVPVAHGAGYGVEGAARGRCPGGFAEGGAGAGEGVDRKAVPVGQDLVVARRPRAFLAARPHTPTQTGETRVVVRLESRYAQAVEDVAAFPIAAGGNVVGDLEKTRVGAQHGLDLALVPDVEAPLLALAVGVEGGGESAGFDDHLAQQPVHGLADAGLEQGRLRSLPYEGEEVENLRVVVKHLLEMRDQPQRVGRVTREAAAEMVVDAALAHAFARHGDGVGERRLAGAQPGAPQRLENGDLGKFRGAAQTAENRIGHGDEGAGGGVEFAAAEIGVARGAGQAGEAAADRLDVLAQTLRFVAEHPGNAFEDLREAGTAVTRRRREIGAAPEGLAVGGEEHGERPAPLFAHEGEGVLVDGVEVGAFLAVDLDVDEKRVHARGGFGVLETLVGHHVAPVARGVTDGQQDGPSVRARLGESVRPPGAPGDGVVLVLEQIGARFPRQKIFRHVVSGTGEFGRRPCAGSAIG